MEVLEKEERLKNALNKLADFNSGKDQIILERLLKIISTKNIEIMEIAEEIRDESIRDAILKNTYDIDALLMVLSDKEQNLTSGFNELLLSSKCYLKEAESRWF